MIIGGDSYLDRQGYCEWPKDIFIPSTAFSSFHNERRKYLTLIGPYIVTTAYQTTFMRQVDAYYEKVRSAADLVIQDVRRIFDQNVQIRVRLECNPKKARALQLKFHRHFD